MAESDGETDYQLMSRNYNRKHKKAGGFQAFGLDHNIYKAVNKRGYKNPTPIQRKTIPLLIDGKDVMAMARTGSGKTAAFLLPMFQKLKTRCPQSGIRALIISPTRELVLQTFKFIKELGKFTGLRAAALVGGDAIGEQFSAVHENPDILVATPGRLLHVAVEMNLMFKNAEYVVFDEADRLFETGFEEQLTEIVKRLPDCRQTCLFSATLPRTLIDFARAGLRDPVVVRLDVDSKLSDKLKMSFFFCRPEDKIGAVLHFLRVMLKDKQRAIVFVPTKHHVEYLKELVQYCGLQCSYLYSSLDSMARREQINAFRAKETLILISTDLAARGVDIPLLDVVINLYFPSSSKLFVHRVGRVARAGSCGVSYSFVSADELPYLVDLFLFLGRQLTILRDDVTVPEGTEFIAKMEQAIVDTEMESVKLYDRMPDTETLKTVVTRAYQQYLRSRPAASAESIRRVKEEQMLDGMSTHPLFAETVSSTSTGKATEDYLNSIKNYRPQTTIFEFNTSSKDVKWQVMKAKRQLHERNIVQHKEKMSATSNRNAGKVELPSTESVPESELQETFSEVIKSKFQFRPTGSKKAKPAKKDEEPDKKNEYFIPYQPLNFHSEQGLAVSNESTFDRETKQAVLDFMGDEVKDFKRTNNQTKWDRKKKKFVGAREDPKDNDRKKRIRLENGSYLPASYKSNLYQKWLKNQRKPSHGSDDEHEDYENKGQPSNRNRRGQGGPGKANDRRVKSELKTKQEILKERKRKGIIKAQQRHRRGINSKRRLGQGKKK